MKSGVKPPHSKRCGLSARQEGGHPCPRCALLSLADWKVRTPVIVQPLPGLMIFGSAVRRFRADTRSTDGYSHSTPPALSQVSIPEVV